MSIEDVFLQCYPDEVRNLSGYENVFNELRLLHPVDTDISISVRHVKDDFDNSTYVDVSGYYNDQKKAANDLTDSLALEFTPWEEWLGMDIEKQALLEFTGLEIICHCLFEMTFMGYDQKEIQEELNRINDVAEEIKSMTEDEKKQNLLSLDDLIERNKNRFSNS